MKDIAFYHWLVEIPVLSVTKNAFEITIWKVTKKCLKREGVSEGAAGPVVKVKRKYVRKKKAEEGQEVAEVKLKKKYARKDKKVVEAGEGEMARRRYRCDHCNYSSNNQVTPMSQLYNF